MGEPARDEESGQFTGSVDDDELLALMTPCEPYTAADLAADVDLTRRAVKHRLDLLADAGELRTKKHGGRTRTFWREPEAADE